MSHLEEAETRRRIFADCRHYYGPEAERQLRMTFDKWDKLLKSCKNDEERRHIKVMAITEIHNMMRYRDGLSINGNVILNADDDFKENSA